MDIYQELGLSRIINAAGKMTYLGSSSLNPETIEVMSTAAQGYVDMEKLKLSVGQKTAKLVGSEGACITACSAAGISVAIAATITGTSLYKIESLPDITWSPNEIIIQKGHMVNFGANIEQCIRITGANIKEIGTANSTKEYHLRGAISQSTAAIVYVVSHHTVQNGMLSLKQVIEIGHEYHIPIIVDAAAETNLRYYTSSGADLVIFSGHKAIGGPTSGIIAGLSDLIEACQLQDKGIARMMKIGKENIMGIYRALSFYMQIDENTSSQRNLKLVQELENQLSTLKILKTSIKWDATRPIPRLQIRIPTDGKINAKQVITDLESGNPSIRTRNHLVDEGIIQFDPREMNFNEIPVIKERLITIFERI